LKPYFEKIILKVMKNIFKLLGFQSTMLKEFSDKDGGRVNLIHDASMLD
jgi:hypothetical protein